MKKVFDFIGRNIDWIFVWLIWVYLLFAFLAPISYKLGWDNLGDGINRVYEEFCHQRVERSVYLFGKETFYSISELKDLNYLPDTPQVGFENIWPEYYGHGFGGNDKVGFKVALCIRDIALYGAIAIMGTILAMIQRAKKKKFSVSIYIIIALLLPMVLDGLLGTVVEVFRLEIIPIWYVNSIEKRIITGTLFGIGLSLFLFPLIFDEKLTNKDKKEKI